MFQSVPECAVGKSEQGKKTRSNMGEGNKTLLTGLALSHTPAHTHTHTHTHTHIGPMSAQSS